MKSLARPSGAACLFAVILLATSACSEIPLFNLEERHSVEYWIKHEQYSKAIDELERRSATRPDEQERKRLEGVKRMAAEYDKTTARRVLALQTQDDWAKAFALLDQGLQNYAEGAQLQKARQTLLQRQTLRKRQLMAQVLLVKAEWLLSNYEMQREIVHIDPENYVAEINLQQAQAELGNIATRLYDYGIHARSSNDLELADHCLTMSYRITPRPKTRKAMDEVIAMQEARRQQQLAIQQKQLLAEIHQSLSGADLGLARKLLQQASNIEGFERNNPELAGLRQALEHAVTTKVGALLEQGDGLYSNEKIEEAKKVWEAALTLDPGNSDVQERIQRAERVLGKLKQLKSRMK